MKILFWSGEKATGAAAPLYLRIIIPDMAAAVDTGKDRGGCA